jgi:hypothetical protein
LGAIYYNDISRAATFLAVSENSNPGEIKIRWKNSDQTVHGNQLDTIKSVQIRRNDELIYEIYTSEFEDTLEYIDVVTMPDYYRYSLCAIDINDKMGQMQYHTMDWLGGPIQGIVVIDLDLTPITGPAIATCLQNIGYSKPVYLAQNTSRYPLETTLDAVFVPLGIFPNNHVLGDGEAQVLKAYLDMGGKVYMEGGDTWYFDPQTVLQPMFNILPVSDGSSDLFGVIGQNGTFTEGMSFNYAGENSWMDHIDPISPAFTIFSNFSPVYNCAVAYNSGYYRTIGTSFEFGGLTDGFSPSTKTELLSKILEFFDVVVPVELISFTAKAVEESIVLNWSTASELNNAGFDIERSNDNIDFAKLEFVKGCGTITNRQDYSFIDNTISSKGKYYYRLKQIDHDGSFEYSDIVEVNYEGIPIKYSLFQNYPNPFNNSTIIKFSLPDEKHVTIKIYNALGEEVETILNEVKTAGRYTINFDATSLSSGLYFYRLVAGDFVETKKMVLLK